jgi:hypothetical protein
MAPKNSTKRSKEPAGAINTLDLEFPDWSGMDDSSARITPEAAFRLCEHYPLLIAKAGHKNRNNMPEKCIVEFIL